MQCFHPKLLYKLKLPEWVERDRLFVATIAVRTTTKERQAHTFWIGRRERLGTSLTNPTQPNPSWQPRPISPLSIKRIRGIHQVSAQSLLTLVHPPILTTHWQSSASQISKSSKSQTWNTNSFVGFLLSEPLIAHEYLIQFFDWGRDAFFLNLKSGRSNPKNEPS